MVQRQKKGGGSEGSSGMDVTVMNKPQAGISGIWDVFSFFSPSSSSFFL